MPLEVRTDPGIDKLTCQGREGKIQALISASKIGDESSFREIMMESSQVVVVGAGPAGASAAIAAAEAGLGVTLIDENPIDMSMMGLDIPLFFGQRMMPTVRDKGLMLQRVVSSNELLQEAQEKGVEVLLGIYVWGSFRNQENSRQLDRPVLGLANEERSWLMEYDRLVLATGARDLVLGFPGRDLVGVMGANAVASLLNRYQAFTGKRMVVLGTGDLGLSTAALALEQGIQVAAIVDVAPSVRGDSELRSRLEGLGTAFYTSHTVMEARGHREVESILISQIDDQYQPVKGAERELECDTICLAIGSVPNVELSYLTGCRLSYRSEMGGYVPDRDQHARTSIDSVYVAGDAGGFYEGMVTSPSIAIDQGRLAGFVIAESLGAKDPDAAATSMKALASSLDVPRDNGTGKYLEAWLSSLLAGGGMDINVCQCEEVTRSEIMDVAPPRYLQWPSRRMGDRTINTLLEEAPIDLDRLKRLTRAGMGYCQGRRCREETAMLVARAAGVDVSQVPLASYRPPVRPLPLKVMWPHEETDQERNDWVKWFRAPTKKVNELS